MKADMTTIKFEYFDELPSTNQYVKTRLQERKNLCVIATKQTAGKGTKGRSFSSNIGGVYLTKLTFYDNFPVKSAFKLMQRTAVAVCETLVFFGLKPKIKWANDVFVGDKKICGILIENLLQNQFVHASIVGVGLNVCNTLEDELSLIATTMQRETGKNFDVEQVTQKLIENLYTAGLEEKYYDYLGWIGEEVTLSTQDKEYLATLVGVDETGGLIVNIDGQAKRFVSGEVKLHIA